MSKMKKKLGKAAAAYLKPAEVTAKALKTSSKVMSKIAEPTHKVLTKVTKAIPTKIDDLVTIASGAGKQGLEEGAKFQGKIEKGIKNMREKFKHNDMSWYTHDAERVRLLTKPNFAQPGGTKLYKPMSLYTYNVGADVETQQGGVPLAMRFGVALTLGSDGSGSDDYNLAINRLYTAIRNANAGAINYTPIRLSSYVQQIRAIIALYAYIRRSYLARNNYSSAQRGMPKGLISATQIDPDDIITNAPEIQNCLAQWRRQLSTYAALNLDIFKRTEWLFSNIFKDGEGIKPQFYVFNLGTVVKPSFDSSHNITADFAKEILLTDNNTVHTWASIKSIMETYITDFAANTDFNIISGDILKAYGTTNLYHLQGVSEDDVLDPVYDEAILTQIENATLLNNAQNVSGFGQTFTVANNLVTEDLFIVMNYSTAAKTNAEISDRLVHHNVINDFRNDITEEMLLEDTRFKIGLKYGTDGNATVQTWGTEVIYLSCISAYDPNSGNAIYHYEINLNRNFGYGATFASALWSYFDWAPAINFVDFTTGIDYVWGLELDFKNYASVDGGQIASFHSVAISSLYYVELLLKENKTVVSLSTY